MDEAQVQFRTRIGKLLEAYRSEVATRVMQDLESKGLTAYPVSHLWITVAGFNEEDEVSIYLRPGKAPPDEARPYYLQGQQLNFSVYLRGTVRKTGEKYGRKKAAVL